MRPQCTNAAPRFPLSPQVWDLATLTLVRTLTGHTDAVRALAVAGDRLFSGSYDSTVRVWDISSMQCLQVRAIEGEGVCVSVWGTVSVWGSPA